ncbi:kinase-like domain-containing protein [Cubamyces lactineus]|nr:kinase-like domain-containing protein [Cubamyces lactineus]
MRPMIPIAIWRTSDAQPRHNHLEYFKSNMPPFSLSTTTETPQAQPYLSSFRTSTNLRPAMAKAEIMSLTDEEIVDLCDSSPNLAGTPNASESPPVPPVYALASNVVVKVCIDNMQAEARAMTLVRARTTIPVPKVYRVFEHRGEHFLVLEYIHGYSLGACWDRLSPWQKLRIAFILRNYIKQFRRIRTPQIEQQVPGPITNDPSQPLRCYTPSLGEYPVRAFTSRDDLRDWMNGQYRVAEYVLRRRMPQEPFDDSEPLVFVHGDLCLRNLILGADGRPWLIDFGFAGVYPRWFEAYGSRDGDKAPARLWTTARKIAVGEYPRQEAFTQTCQVAFLCASCMEDPGEHWPWDENMDGDGHVEN